MKRFQFCPLCAKPLEARDLVGVRRRACPDERCGYILYDNPTPVVGALVEYGDRVVLVQNKGWPASWFGLLTGFLERGESAEDGVLREIKEETGLDGRIIRLLGVYPFFAMNQILIIFHVKAEGVLTIGDELAAYKLVPPDELKPWPSGTGQAVSDWLASRRPNS